VVDLESSGGTRVNDERVSARLLCSGDILQVGKSQFRFEDQVSSRAARNLAAAIPISIRPDADTGFLTIKRNFDQPASAIRDSAISEIQSMKAQQRLAVICNLAALIGGRVSLEKIFESCLDATIEVTGASRGAIVLRGPSGADVQPVWSRLAESDKRKEFHVSQTVLSEVMKDGVSVMSGDVSLDDRLKSGKSLAIEQVRSVMCVPVRSESEILGAIYIDMAHKINAFVDLDLALVAAIGQQLGIAIERFRLIEDLQALFVGAVHTLVATIESKDRYTKGHSERVTAYSLLIADELSLPAAERDVLEIGGLLHDVGKIGVPESILCKPGRLTEEEFAEIRKHPQAGVRIVSHILRIERIVPVSLVAQAVRHHHERFDGYGYPDRLVGLDIPLSSRILAIGDTFDAITTNRSYRSGRPPEVAVGIIRENAGTQFDPNLIDAFVRAYESGRLERPESVSGRFRFGL
jgi:HD-GYP domain-containing protein (c-di-GMP phosphodiesterase class II)